MVVWGVTAFNHDTSIAVISENNLRFFETVNGQDYCGNLAYRAINSTGLGPKTVGWYERPWLKKTRQAYAGQWDQVFDFDVLPSKWIKRAGVSYTKLVTFPHHKSHAAAGFLTSPFDEAAVVVLDAIGEWESASIWHGKGNDLKKVWSVSYPNSLGLFYSAFTKRIGFIPISGEHFLQELAGKGDPSRFYNRVNSYFKSPMNLRINLHRGVWDWDETVRGEDYADIAAAVQQVFEEQAQYVMNKAKELVPSNNLVYMGGCSMNSKFNQRLDSMWDGIWSLPSPGDPSSAIGAALLAAKTRIEWNNNLAKHLKVKYNR